jgi:hypothetical protein
MTAVQPWGRVTVTGPDGAELARCVLAGPGEPGLGAVDIVAGLALLARRHRGRMILTDAAPALRELLELAGLPIEAQGQAERREQPLGVQEREEEMHRGDLPL